MVKLEQFNKHIKLLRLQKDMSQEDLARAADLKLSNLSKLEGGFSSNPTLTTLYALASVLTSGSIDCLLSGKSKNVSKVLDVRGLGSSIKSLRLQKDMSQEDLARAADLKLSNLSKLEGGFSSNPTLTTLYALASVLTGGDIDKLFKKGIK